MGRPGSRRVSRSAVLLTGMLGLSALVACSSSTVVPPQASGDITAAPPASFAPTTVTLLTHDAFSVDKSVLAAFARQTGITIKVVTAGDAGELVNKAVLTAGNPEGDVLFGVDNTLLSRAVGAGVFAPYRPAALAQVAPALRALVPGDAVVPIDFGDVCVVADEHWFAAHSLPVPSGLDALTDPRYAGRLVVENPATSSPGLAFLLATVARYGGGWTGYWSRLRANGVKVDNDWTSAYNGDFTAGGQKGTYPLVVSYGTDPVASIEYAADPKPTTPTVGVLTDSCFRQVEFAGVLAGTTQTLPARAVVDFLLSQQFQQGIPLSMYVFPSVTSTPLPAVFSKWAVQSPAPLQVSPDQITAHRSQWVDQWTQVVLH